MGILVMAFGLLDNLHSISSHYHEKKRFSRLQRVGYAQRIGRTAVDSRDFEYEVLDLCIQGNSYAVRLEDLVRALSTHGAVMIEELSREWKSFLGVPCGLAQVSVSGKGLNIELFNVGLYTTSLFALRWVIESKERYAAIVKIPEQPVMPAWKDRRISPEQQRLSAFA